MNEEGFYEVEGIVQHREKGVARGKPVYEYWVKWAGYPESENSWVPASNFLKNDLTKSMLVSYHRQHGLP